MEPKKSHKDCIFQLEMEQLYQVISNCLLDMIESVTDSTRLNDLITLLSILPKSDRHYHLCLTQDQFTPVLPEKPKKKESYSN